MTAPGDWVLDPYVGSGSSVIAAVKNGRDGYGCDVERKYIDIAKRRVSDLYAGRLQTRPIERPIYDPRLPGGGLRSGHADYA